MKQFLLLLITLLMTLSVAHAGNSESIMAVVNKSAVTASDVKDRMALIMASSGLTPSPELINKLRPQVVDMLIDEQIRQQEAKRLKIEVSKQEIDDGFAQIAKQNNIPADVFANALKQRGIKLGTMRDQIKTQIAWTKIVQSKIRPQIDVTDSDIDNELNFLHQKVGQDQYSIAEIYLPVGNNKNKGDAKRFADKLVEQLRTEPQAFDKASQQFSQAPTAGRGASWVMEGSVPREVGAILPKLTKDAISDPIETSTGFYIIKLADKRALDESQLPNRDQITEKIGLQRMDRLQRKYYMDLRSQAFIEKRG